MDSEDVHKVPIRRLPWPGPAMRSYLPVSGGLAAFHPRQRGEHFGQPAPFRRRDDLGLLAEFQVQDGEVARALDEAFQRETPDHLGTGASIGTSRLLSPAGLQGARLRGGLIAPTPLFVLLFSRSPG